MSTEHDKWPCSYIYIYICIPSPACCGRLLRRDSPVAFEQRASPATESLDVHWTQPKHASSSAATTAVCKERSRLSIPAVFTEPCNQNCPFWWETSGGNVTGGKRLPMDKFDQWPTPSSSPCQKLRLSPNRTRIGQIGRFYGTQVELSLDVRFTSSSQRDTPSWLIWYGSSLTLACGYSWQSFPSFASYLNPWYLSWKRDENCNSSNSVACGLQYVRGSRRLIEHWNMTTPRWWIPLIYGRSRTFLFGKHSVPSWFYGYLNTFWSNGTSARCFRYENWPSYEKRNRGAITRPHTTVRMMSRHRWRITAVLPAKVVRMGTSKPPNGRYRAKTISLKVRTANLRPLDQRGDVARNAVFEMKHRITAQGGEDSTSSTTWPYKQPWSFLREGVKTSPRLLCVTSTIPWKALEYPWSLVSNVQLWTGAPKLRKHWSESENRSGWRVIRCQ